ACPERIEVGELLPGLAAQDAEEIEQRAQPAIEREVEIVRGVELRVRRIADPRRRLQALVHAVGGDDVDVLQPADQAARNSSERTKASSSCQAGAADFTRTCGRAE